ncbi:polysaccharide lyase [Planctomycetes bacterium K23_9]|uniref:Polysaccharide lyase 14 domain-containing protein n=1 Tax=Stieleria marina TaxID=1930275 RepID=A0A517NY95_9BACT|nr:hypothetical protein K239x_41040 [Planctomycetes bacterium K23_9]
MLCFFRCPLVAVLSFALSCLAFGASNCDAQVVYENAFGHYSQNQLYTKADWKLDWYSPVWEDGIREDRVAIQLVPNFRGNTTASLSVLYPAGAVGPKDGGAQWKLDLPSLATQVRLRYRVKFGEGFDFVRGGKLPGLAGGTAPTGNTRATGYNGWSARVMWRTDYEGLPGVVPQTTANLVQYVKHPTSGYDQTGRDEDDYYWHDDGVPIEVESGRWYLITQLVKLNTVGRSNGRIKVWIDGQRVLDQRDIEFRYTDRLKIDVMYFSTFFGGGSDDWAPSKDEVIFFDDFNIELR